MPTFGPPEYPEVGTIEDSYMRSVARLIADHLVRTDPVHVIYEPGNGSHYELILTPRSTANIVRNSRFDGSYPEPRWGTDQSVVYVSLIPNAAYPLELIGRSRYDVLHPTYLTEKLRCTESDGAVLANLLTEVGEATRSMEAI